jgi:zinc transport system substrate-binding protein
MNYKRANWFTSIRGLIPPLALLILTLTSSISYGQPIKLITSVQPVQMIVSAISNGVAEPSVLLPAGATPHEYSLKPSNVRDISNADLLFWIGPSLETFLEKTLNKFTQKTGLRVVSLIESPGLTRIHLDSEHQHHDDHHHSVKNLSSQETSATENLDPHIWLDPLNALAMAQQVAAVLSETDPSHTQQYQQNLQLFRQRITQLDQQLSPQFNKIKERGYFVFHDAYSYFEQRYGLNRLGEFSVNESKPSVKKMMEIQAIIKQGKAVCIFSEPQFNPALIDAVTRGTDVRRASLDPLGDSYNYSKPGAEHYFEFMYQFADQFIDCLSGKR